MTALPGWIAAALDRRLEGVSRTTLRERALAISDAYRAGGSSEALRDEADALAYALTRMPATFAAASAAMAQARALMPGFAPATLLDAGAGPGTAAWAAAAAFPSIARAALIDRNDPLLALARGLREAPGAPDIAPSWTVGEFVSTLGAAATADLVLASYALTELAPAAAEAALARLWELTGRLLLVVEPGTANSFRRVLGYRHRLIAAGATIVAPCSHHAACPLADVERWCHFGVRLPRSRDHLIVKDANVPFEDEKFIYLAAVRGEAAADRGKRILATPQVGKTGVTLTLCAPGEAERRTIRKRDKEAFRYARRCGWGDAWREA